ncbi:MAG: uracil-DNA glycosylase [Deltaproteobacteria bacterium]|nr:uracil-DNA glycosylase [Deltaproteobacteria bacterium]
MGTREVPVTGNLQNKAGGVIARSEATRQSPPTRDTRRSPRPSGTRDDKQVALDELNTTQVKDCTKCRLCEGRTQTVFGVGNPDADLMFVGEGPGRDEDAKGEPFVGRAGQLLTKIIEAMGFKRSDVYIGNCVKCRPPNNRQPAPDEMATCLPYLRRQIEIIEPKVIVCLGATAVAGLLQTDQKISRIRGQWQEWDGMKVMPTFHPAFLLRNPEMKKPVWEDMKKVMEYLKSTTAS